MLNLIIFLDIYIESLNTDNSGKSCTPVEILG